MVDNKKAFEQLEMIKNEYGIELIEEFIKKSKKRKKRGRPLSGLMTGAEVYFELFGFDFENEESYKYFSNASISISITEAKENVSTRKGIEVKTVDKHITKINKYANDMNYTEFCSAFNNFHQGQNYEEWNENDLARIDNHIIDYANEREGYDNYSRISFTEGDYRYSGIERKLAIALFLKYKYDKSKNAHKVPKKTDNEPYGIPLQQQYVPQQQNNDDE